MSKLFFTNFRNHFLNVSGETLKKKIVVFESDDWGSIRIPSKKGYNELVANGIPLNNNPYNQFDALESVDDLNGLYEVLQAFKDLKGNNPIITANFVMGNPDFNKIADSKFESYFFEPFTETYKQSNHTYNSWDLIKSGIDNKFIKPQFHCREHLNVMQWLSLLQEGNESVLKAFEKKVFSLDVPSSNGTRNNLMAAFDYRTTKQKDFAITSLEEGLRMFQETFGFSSQSIISPCNVWDDTIEEIASRNEVQFIQSLRGILIPTLGQPSYTKKYVVSGERNKYNQVYTVRNAYFEPSTDSNYNWVMNCIHKIEAAFFWNKPAIISTHRLNFMGSISEENRTKNLALFKLLLKEILKKWPEVEFMSSDELGEEYLKKIRVCVE
jgi:hypothetical protein